MLFSFKFIRLRIELAGALQLNRAKGVNKMKVLVVLLLVLGSLTSRASTEVVSPAPEQGVEATGKSEYKLFDDAFREGVVEDNRKIKLQNDDVSEKSRQPIVFID